MEPKKKLVSIIIPCFNEEESLPKLYEQLDQVLTTIDDDYEILFVDDGSQDDTLSVIKRIYEQDSHVAYISLSRNFGKESAMLAGIDHIGGNCAIFLDADLQDPPQLILQMLEHWKQGYHDVYAKREGRGKENWLRKKLSMLFYSILDRSTRFDILPNVGDYRLLDRKCIDALRQMRETERYTKGMFAWIGFKKKEIVFNRGDRVDGESKMSLLSLFNLAIEGITSFTTTPLRFASVSGFIIAFFAFGLLLFYLIKTILYGDPVQGFPTLVTIILFLGGIQLLCIGILGEYIGIIFNEAKHRPLYLIEESGERKIASTKAQ